MALGTFVAGRYSSTLDPPGATGATDLGIMREGYRLSWRLAAEAIRESDQHGEQFIDGIYRGLADVMIQCDALEYKAGPLLAATPFQTLAPSGSTFLGPGVIGRLMSALAGVLVLTNTTGTPAATFPTTLTATFAHLAENFDVSLLFNSKLREVPLRMRFILYDDAGTPKFFTAT